MKQLATLFVSLGLLLSSGCGGSDGDTLPEATPPEVYENEGYERAEDSLGTLTIGELEIELAQGHGGVLAGKVGHLVVKLPYSDGGSTIVRAWIGTEVRTRSYVGKGEYARSHDDYDVHATAPDPLSENARWWIEIEKPDGTKHVGSAQPLFE